MRAGDINAAIEEYLRREYVYVSPRLFRTQSSSRLDGIINRGIHEELNSFHCEDAARNFYLFLLLNDQRRKLRQHFEGIDIHRLELQLPFFDSAFLTLVISIPIDLCLRHKFYVKWLAHFHSSVTSVPWQAYPGHEPCPLPIPQELAYQWAGDYQAAERATQKQRLLQKASELLHAADFPEILNKRNLRIAAWIHSTGWRDYEHIIEPALIYHMYWKKCRGAYNLPSNNTSETS